VSSNDINIDFDKLVEVFNNDGRPAAEKFIEDTYGIAYNIVQRRLTKETSYVYNRAIRKYVVKNSTEDVFISTDKLFKGKPEPKQVTSNYVEFNFNDILTDILKDRLLELSKYFTISQSTKEISINMKLLKSSGYKLNILE
jgi:hypothetical protein